MDRLIKLEQESSKTRNMIKDARKILKAAYKKDNPTLIITAKSAISDLKHLKHENSLKIDSCEERLQDLNKKQQHLIEVREIMKLKQTQLEEEECFAKIILKHISRRHSDLEKELAIPSYSQSPHQMINAKASVADLWQHYRYVCAKVTSIKADLEDLEKNIE